MNTRIKEARKLMGWSQDEFALQIGLTKNFISLMETGARSPSDRTIADICRVCHIRREWLEFGEGAMEEERTRNQELTDMFEAAMENPDTGKARLLAAMSKMTDDQWEDLAKLIQMLAGNK